MAGWAFHWAPGGSIPSAVIVLSESGSLGNRRTKGEKYVTHHLRHTRWLRVMLVSVTLLTVLTANVSVVSASRSIRNSEGPPPAAVPSAAPAPASAPPVERSGGRSVRGGGEAGTPQNDPAPAQAPVSNAPPVAVPSPSEPVQVGACRDGEEWVMLALINDYRAQNGLTALQMTQTLSNAAEFHSADMASRNYFGHTLASGASWADNMAAFGYGYATYRAENIAAGNLSAAGTFQQWLNSPEHNANMLNANVSAIGIGRASGTGSDFGTYWTTTFGGLVDGGAC